MSSDPTLLGRASPSPPPPPPKNRGPGLPSNPAVTKNQTRPQSPPSATNPSPVRRKPLPRNTFSPPLPPIQTAQPSTQIFGQVIQHLANRGRNESAQQLPLSPDEISLNKPTPIFQGPPVDTSPNPAPLLPPNNLTRELSHPDSLAQSSSNGTLPRVSTEDFPEPPRHSTPIPVPADGPQDETAIAEQDEEDDMALKPGTRPPPLRTDTTASAKSLAIEQKKPQTPGSKFTSFFTRKQTASPGTESNYTESEQGKSPLPSPYPNSDHPSNTSAKDYGFPERGPTSQSSKDSIEFDASPYMQAPAIPDRSTVLEAELREISKELASSIKREMDLEDLVERLQTEGPAAVNAADRTSDYFSDSGTSSIRPNTSDYSPKEEMERVKRDAEQQRAQMKVDFSNKWQREMATRKAMESHLQYMEHRHADARGQINSTTDASTKAERLEAQLKDLKRQLIEERQTKDNFQDLLSALQGDLEEHRNQRDNLRDEVVPQLKTRIEGLESTLADAQKSPYDAARMQHELQSLRDENAALHSARMMNAQFESIAEEDGTAGSGSSFFGMRSGLQRTGTLGRSNSRAGMTRSNSVSKKNQLLETPQQLAEALKAAELQRDALHNTVKYLLRRQTLQTRQYEKRLKVADIERERSNSFSALTGRPVIRKGGFEREVRGLRAEINLLRKRADDALEQKWQCEKGLAGLKMDLDRSKQETESLHRLLQARDSNSPEFLSSSLEKALLQLNQRQNTASLSSLQTEQQLSDQLEQSADQIRQQLKTNTGLRNRLKEAITKGERDQTASAAQISELEGKLRKLEDTITAAQTQSETAVMKHEEDIRVLRASTNMHLLRTKNATSGILSSAPRSPLSPMLSNSKRSPRLDKTSSGPGMALSEALKTEWLEKKVEELEAALAEAEREMGEVVGRMNGAQMGVAELEGERDEALRQTRKLEEKVRMLVGGLGLPSP